MPAFRPYTFLFHDDKGNVIREHHNWSHAEYLLPSDALSMARGLGTTYRASTVVVFEGCEITNEPFFVCKPDLEPESVRPTVQRVEMSEEDQKAWDNWPW